MGLSVQKSLTSKMVPVSTIDFFTIEVVCVCDPLLHKNSRIVLLAVKSELKYGRINLRTIIDV